MRRAVQLSVALLALPLIFAYACGGPPGALDVRSFPAEQQANYQIFENRCSRCHDLVRPLAARIGQGGWEAYVSRMSRHPGAGIGPADQQAIAAFLEFYHSKPSTPTEEGAP
jgi:hypothetical protein